VDHRPSCKIQDTHLTKDAIGMPGHMSEGGVDEYFKKHHKEHIGSEPDALGKGSRDQSWRDDGKL
jgi:hypothetical protein